MTQGESIIQYMEDFGSITPLQAFADLGVTKLATRISELRRGGLNVHKEVIHTYNRYGNPTHYMKYSLENEER